ncbi:hypothetical protein DCAR_0831741 [Daucus carota subsp. sativus]|uniref:BTB domain-containing protein n=1 Tax=Daucus carota subsp. sativus TaxID=79200 RepID=A0AAF0XSB5_DAUCS|nr:hypothetical protein DCAR_0831741 [Daucus carota subsp. sativus]
MGSDICTCNFEFAYNDPKFSDRVLSIEIIPDPLQIQPSGTFTFVCDDKKMHREEHTFNSSIPDVGDGAVVDDLSSGCLSKFRAKATRRHDAARIRDISTVLYVNTIHINSAVLAVKSPFFYKLFSNGMMESEQRVATLQIHASEVPALMELLKFMYTNTLTTATHAGLLDILLVADKFEVASCMRYCSQQLSKLPMTCDFAHRYMDLPYSILHVDALQQLTDSVKQFIAVHVLLHANLVSIKLILCAIFTRFEDQVLNLPLAGIEAILSSDDIQVPSEDVLYDLVLKWSELHYPQLEERREVLETHLVHLIRFPYMTSPKLKEVVTGTNFSPEVASEIVLEALFFQTGTRYRQRQLAPGRQVADETAVNTYRRFVEWAYILWPVKSVQFKLPRRHCFAYLDLKREECLHLFPTYCNMDQQNVSQCFGLFLGMKQIGSASLAVDFEFAARSYEEEEEEEEEEYKIEHRGSETLTGENCVGRRNIFGRTWSEFIAGDSPYFIKGNLFLRAKVTIK